MIEEAITSKKISIFAQDIERETWSHLPSLLKHCQENNCSINKHHFKTIISNMNSQQASRI